ncbi:TonB-dependent receptor [Sediminibacterium soli]|uniref:TonB-dependent receptor n=1 Tax=Sediminibacterium soli TaxID=2698829 RepID=UPI00137AAF61|nr:TonB-dependent receptor [Sediminibacterium soli]NCI47095.1 TonB-dependent receptor [Sediminibacterium soli]
MKPFCFLCVYLFAVTAATGQDTVRRTGLDEVVVEAFHSRVLWKTAPASVAVLGVKEMSRYAGTSLVPVINTVAGVRMEERSPASYRLSFRGSLLRSPFGVRNIKVYWNNLPLTDGGGNTYLNLIDISQVGAMELLKGPAASVYGAGTGGALLLKSELPYTGQTTNRFRIGITGGAYGLFSQQAGWDHVSGSFTSSLTQLHQQSDGYRDQSATRKDALRWQGGWQWRKSRLNYLVFYSDLYYQTPGGITLAQMQANPKTARQPVGVLPGAVQQKAAIYNKTLFAGLSHQSAIGDHWMLRSFLMASQTRFANPFITNYEKRKENNIGMGLGISYTAKNIQWQNGAEWLYNRSAIDNYGNRSGVADMVQYQDKVFASQWFVYSQWQFTPGRWNITAGASLNNQSYRYSRLTDPMAFYQTKRISAVVTPRVAVSYRLNSDVTLYAMAAKGFSPPTLAEFRPSDGRFHGDLNAEYGWNYEAGIKGYRIRQRLQFDLAIYYFRLRNAIVRRNDSTGAEFFVNAGGTVQKGLEAMLKYDVFQNGAGFVRDLDIWSSYAWQDYRFDDYRQGSAVFSGNAVTGVPRHNWVTGADIRFAKGWYLQLSFNLTSKLPLTDAGDVYAEASHLLQGKLGYRTPRHWHFFAGMDNILNEVYSLGNDINAAGRRFYNPAPRRNLFAGILLQFGN